MAVKPTERSTTCCVVGGGPAGIMTGFLLAKQGIQTVVLEKHSDFLRDFRGDTIHPSTLQVMKELGLLERLLERPHQKAERVSGFVGDVETIIADFSQLRNVPPFLVFMPQWEFLDFISTEARSLPQFNLMMECEVTDLNRNQDKINGVIGKNSKGEFRITADLVIGADGRHSIVREKAGLAVRNLGAPMDVLWMKLKRSPEDPSQPLGRFNQGQIFIMLNRGEYWQCGYVIPKGSLDHIRQRGIHELHSRIAKVAPFLKERIEALSHWEDIKLLSVTVDRLKNWALEGLLCIGDSAHAMSPIGGVGINLAIQDAIATSNLLGPSLLKGPPSLSEIQQVQNRRELPTKLTQGAQVFIQSNIIEKTLNEKSAASGLPFPLRLLQRFPKLRRLPARFIGVGFRPEHVKT